MTIAFAVAASEIPSRPEVLVAADSRYTFKDKALITALDVGLKGLPSVLRLSDAG